MSKKRPKIVEPKHVHRRPRVLKGFWNLYRSSFYVVNFNIESTFPSNQFSRTYFFVPNREKACFFRVNDGSEIWRLGATGPVTYPHTIKGISAGSPEFGLARKVFLHQLIEYLEAFQRELTVEVSIDKTRDDGWLYPKILEHFKLSKVFIENNIQ